MPPGSSTSGTPPNASFTITPSGTGPFYQTLMGFDPSLTETTFLGAGFFLDVPPGGTGELTVNPPEGVTCVRDPRAWAGSDERTNRIPLRRGFLTGSVDFRCE